MPSLTYYALQKAIYEKLIGDSSLMSLISGVFDYTPQDTAFPFVNINNYIASDLSDIAVGRTQYQFDVNIWSREAGNKQAADIMEIIYGLLHNGNITIAGKTLVIMKFISNNLELEDDGWTYHGTMKLIVVLSDN